MTTNDSHTDPDGGTTSRRGAMRALGLGAGAIAAGAVGGAVARSDPWRRETVTFEVALLGDTWRDASINWRESESDFRGQPFQVEGLIYPDGFMPEVSDGFVPSVDGSIGHWYCRGNTLIYADRLEPHVASTQEFQFGRSTPDSLFADDTLVTSGLEGTVTRQVSRRAVIGGTGRYLAASGVQAQVPTGMNTTLFSDGFGNGPNLRMTFELLIPDV